LGDMLELGDAEVKDHCDLGLNSHLQASDIVHCSGPLMHHLWSALPEGKRGQYTETAADLAAIAASLVDAGDVVLVKGSKGSKVSLVVDALRKLGHRRLKHETEQDQY